MLKKSNGVGLLEVMLVLVIIGLLIMISVRYFSSTNATNKRASAIAQMNSIFSVSKSYIDAEENPRTDLLSSSASDGGALVDSDYLTAADTINPWQGKINVCWGTSGCVGNDSTTLKITMEGIPASDCTIIVGNLSKSTVKATCNGSDPQTLDVYYQIF